MIEKGAFTGTSAQHLGRFERAHGGTPFLDEAGELDGNLQAKLEARTMLFQKSDELGGGSISEPRHALPGSRSNGPPISRRFPSRCFCVGHGARRPSRAILMSSVATNDFTRTEFTGIGQTLSDESRPYLARTETVARMVLACTVTTIVVMTFRIPYAFLGIFYAFVVSRQRPEWLLRNGFPAAAGSAAAVVYVAAGVQLFYDDDVLHLYFWCSPSTWSSF